MADIFSLPPITAKTTRSIRAALAYVRDSLNRHTDARDILKGLVLHHDAKLTYPTYRTAFRCRDIYSEAATCCDLSTAKLLLLSFCDKAERYISSDLVKDMFDQLGPARAAIACVKGVM